MPATPPDSPTPGCTLEIGGAIVLTSLGGVPAAECALFFPEDIELEAERPGTNRETGYRTTAGTALARLGLLDITPEAAGEAVDIVRPAIARAYARGPAARLVVDRLEADELFEASIYDVAAARYDGVWLDLPALARDLGRENAALVVQALHLAAMLARVPEETSVFLATSGATAGRRPGERSLRRVDLSGVREVLDSLKILRPARPRDAADAGPSRGDVLAWIQERARRFGTPQRRLAAMEAALSTREAPARGPLSETAVWNLETKISRGELAGVLEQIDAIEQRRGRGPGTAYLRARVALMTRSEEPRAIAERAAELATSMTGFHEVELLAAQAWFAAGDARRARAFARDLNENASADEVLRLQARAVLENAGPPSSATTAAVVASASAATARIETARRAPSMPDVERPGGGADSIRSRSSASMRSLPAGSSFPPFRVEGARAPTRQSRPERERVETLSLPPGAQAEAAPPSDPQSEPPRTPNAARLACTFLARELARELRLQHDVDVQDDLEGLETAQRYLRETFVDGRVRTPPEEREIMRHGAFLGELIARRLGGVWAEVDSPDVGTWSMVVPVRSRPGETLRVWPFGRVLRFVAMGHRERDLVSYYLELEARCR